MTTKFYLLLAAFFISFSSSAQVRACLDVVSLKRTTGAGQGVYDFNNKWTPGSTLNVSFIGGTEWQHSKVKQYAPLWSQVANVKFNFVSSGGDIRIAFNPQKGSYSFIGLDCRNRMPSQETMNLGWINNTVTEQQIKGVILHEFGHALGLLHEHMNPMSNIRWNKPVVYAYYQQYNGWDREMVDRQVFDRYSVSMTNKNYDPRSIMHYPIPANFTTDGYSVGENNDLSPSDRKLIAELYPFNKTYPTSNRTNVWSQLQDLNIEYDVKQDGKLGMRIKQDFLIHNAQGKKCIMAAYFYNADTDKPLKDRNGIKASVDGNVADFTEFTPSYQSSQYTDLTLFLPYDELELGSGTFRLKCFVAIFDDKVKQITSSGYQYFTFRQGTTVKEVQIQTKFNDTKQQIEITPVFTISNAKGQSCHAVAYFYDRNGKELKSYSDIYTTTGKTLASTVDFKPGYDVTTYNTTQFDFIIALPYRELNLPKGKYSLQYKVILYDDNWQKLASTGLYSFSYTQY